MSHETDRLKELLHNLVAEKLKEIETKNLSIDNMVLEDDLAINVTVSFNLLIHLR